MTDKEKEAIKYFYNLRATIDESKMLFDEDINVKCGEETIKQITTILNFIEKQQAEIEKLKNNNKDLLRKLRNRVKEVEKLEKYSLYKKEFATLNKRIEKKDKIIDLMASAIGYEPLPIDEYCVFRNFDCPVVGGNRDCKDCIKQYFERKIEQ